MISRPRITELLNDRGLRGPVLKLLSGTGIAFAVSYIAKVILLKLYTPADFGVFAFVAASAAILGPLATLRYEDALMLPEDDRTSAHVLLVSMSCLVATSLVLLSGVFLQDVVAGPFADTNVLPWIWTIPIVLLVSRASKILELWLTRIERFGLVSAGQVLHSATMTVTRISLGLVRATPGGLIAGFVIGFASSIALYARSISSSLRKALHSGIDARLLKAAAGRYRRFPIFTMPATLLGTAVAHLPAILLLYYFDSATLGIYSQAVAVLFVPLSQVGGAVAQVFFVRAVQARRRDDLDRLSSLVHRRLVALSIFPAGVAMIAGADLFQFVFGETWRPAGEFLLYLAPWLCLSAVASPLTRLFDVLERQKLELITTMVILAVVTSALVLGGQTGNVKMTLLYLGVGGFVVRVGQVIVLLKLAEVSFEEAVKPYLTYGLYSVLLFGILAYTVSFGNLLASMLSSIGVSLIYGAIILHKDQLLATRDSSSYQ